MDKTPTHALFTQHYISYMYMYIYSIWVKSACVCVLSIIELKNARWNNETLSLRSPLNVSDQVSHPYKTTVKIIVLYVLIFIFLDSHIGTQNILHQMIASITWLQSALNFFLNRILICKDCSQICELFYHFKRTIISLYTVTSSCILTSRHDNVLSFISVHF